MLFSLAQLRMMRDGVELLDVKANERNILVSQLERYIKRVPVELETASNMRYSDFAYSIFIFGNERELVESLSAFHSSGAVRVNVALYLPNEHMSKYMLEAMERVVSFKRSRLAPMPEVEFTNGTKVTFYTQANPHAIRGHHYDFGFVYAELC